MTICPIVEGFGEVESLPLLIRRRIPTAIVATPLRVSKDKFLRDEEEFSRALTLAVRKSGAGGSVLILLDGDGSCPVELSNSILLRARKFHEGRNIRVVIADLEFETWFIAGIEKLRGYRGVPMTASKPQNPESIQGAKEWVKALTGRYSSRVDQPAFSSMLNFDTALESRSFRKLLKEIDTMEIQDHD